MGNVLCTDWTGTIALQNKSVTVQLAGMLRPTRLHMQRFNSSSFGCRCCCNCGLLLLCCSEVPASAVATVAPPPEVGAECDPSTTQSSFPWLMLQLRLRSFLGLLQLLYRPCCKCRQSCSASLINALC